MYSMAQKSAFLTDTVSPKSHGKLLFRFRQDDKLLQNLNLLVPALDHLDCHILLVHWPGNFVADSRRAVLVLLHETTAQLILGKGI